MKDKFSKFSLPLLWFFATIVIIFMMTLTVNAESSNPLPYIVANENVDGFENFIFTLSSSTASSHASTFVNAYENDNYFGYDYYESGIHKYAFYVPADSFDYSFSLSSSYDNFDITTDSADFTFQNYYFIKGYTQPAPRGGYYFYGSYQDTLVSTLTTVRFFQGSNKGDGNALAPNISSQNYVYNDDEYQVVFGFGNPERPIIPNGHATPPNNFDSPVYDTGHAQPTQVPTAPTINNYSWTTHNNPPIDTTNLETLTSSLIDIVVYNFNYFFTNLSGLFTNLISNISSFFSYIGQVIEYYGNLIISNIQNLITTFYNNMVSLVEGIGNMVNYIIEPVDSAAINNAFNNTSFIGLKSQFTTFFTTFENAFDISEPNTFTLTINIQNIRTFYNFGCRSPVIIHLDEHFIPIRTALRTFLWIFISFGTVFIVERGLSDWLRGENDTK